jgi:hypothetical protein
MSESKLEARLRASALLVMSGLAAELGSLGWRHPTSFLLFVLIGGSLMAAGIGLFVHSIISKGE